MKSLQLVKRTNAMADHCHFCLQLKSLNDLPGDQLIGQFRHTYVLLAPWQFYTGYCILVSKRHATELFELAEDDRQGMMEEVTTFAHAIHQVFRPRKINYELLGNQVPHIHWHIIPRYESDPDHLKPAWIALDQAERDSEIRKQLLGTVDRMVIAERIRTELNWK